MKFRLLILLLLSVFASCKLEKREPEASKKNESSVIDKKTILDKQTKSLLNKEILSLKKVIGDSISTEEKVYFIYNGFDCGVCVDIGYRIVKRIDSQTKSKITFIVSTQSNIHSEQSKNEYYDYVFNDKNDLIRRELNYIKTPVLIFLDKSNKVSSLYFPNYDRSDEVLKEENEFIESIVFRKKT